MRSLAVVIAMSCTAGAWRVASAEDAAPAPAPAPASAATKTGAGAASAAVPSPAPPSAPAAAAPRTAETSAEAVARGDYLVRLRDLEERVTQLKEKIFQSKVRLAKLQEVVLRGTLAGARTVIIHRNEMGSSFRLVQLQYALDGAVLQNRVDVGVGELEKLEELEIYAGSVTPGNHQLSVYLEYQGQGFSLFGRPEDDRFKVRSSYAFTADEGKVTTLRVVGFEKGGFTTDMKDRPALRYDLTATPQPEAADAGPARPAAP